MSSFDLIERMAEAGRQNKGSIYTEMEAAARVMLEAMRQPSPAMWQSGKETVALYPEERLNGLCARDTWAAMLAIFAKENGLADLTSEVVSRWQAEDDDNDIEYGFSKD